MVQILDRNWFMRRINKFKYFYEQDFIWRKFNNKLRTFHHPKRNSWKLKLVKKKFVGSSITKVSFRFIKRSKRSHKSKLVAKKYLKSLFDNISLKCNWNKWDQCTKEKFLRRLLVIIFATSLVIWRHVASGRWFAKMCGF